MLDGKPENIAKIEFKLYQLLIVGKQKSAAVDESVDDVEPNTSMLDIEREAVLERVEKENQAKLVFDAVSNQLTATILNAIEHRLAVPVEIQRYIGLTEPQIKLLELLYSESPDINKTRVYIDELPWLAKDLQDTVNSASFRHRRPKRSDVKVTDIKLVLSFIGMENLRTLIPYFCVRKWLPSGHTNLQRMTRKLWRYTIVTAIAAQVLARQYEKSPFFAYTCALLYQLGMLTVLNNSAGLFSDIRGHWLKEAGELEDKDIYDAVLATEFPAKQALEQVMHLGLRLNWYLLELVGFKESDMTKVLKELGQSKSYADFSEDAALIARANGFAKILLLEEQHKLYPQERDQLIAYYQLTEAELTLLRSQNYRELDIL